MPGTGLPSTSPSTSMVTTSPVWGRRSSVTSSREAVLLSRRPVKSAISSSVSSREGISTVRAERSSGSFTSGRVSKEKENFSSWPRTMGSPSNSRRDMGFRSSSRRMAAMRCSTRISVARPITSPGKRFSMTEAGTLPLRKPGMVTEAPTSLAAAVRPAFTSSTEMTTLTLRLSSETTSML